MSELPQTPPLVHAPGLIEYVHVKFLARGGIASVATQHQHPGQLPVDDGEREREEPPAQQ